ncbi:MAG TPA: hypothetical protein VKP30_05390, partial [Polyangiaceae bacterium]|nr:hypothetical protein [Polyangiaceae bacterium]
ELFPHDSEVANAIDGVIPKQDQLPLFSQAQLLRAITLQKQQRPRWAETRESLLTRIVARLRVMGGRADLEDSATEHAALLDAKDRTLAFVLRSLVAQPSPQLMTSAVLRGLIAARKTETWSSTQAAAFALTAIAEYQSTTSREPAESVDVVWSGNQPLFTASLGGEHWQKTSAVQWRERLGQQPLVFEHRGNGTLFYTARLHFVPASVPRGTSSTTFELTHSIAAARDSDVVLVERPVASEVHLCLGDFVQGEIQVFSSRTRHHVMVEVPLPAGLEPVESGEGQRSEGAGAASLTQSPFDRPYHTRIAPDRVRFYVELMKPGQLRFHYSARARILGSFALPPARVSEQYNPDQSAATPASRVIITPR